MCINREIPLHLCTGTDRITDLRTEVGGCDEESGLDAAGWVVCAGDGGIGEENGWFGSEVEGFGEVDWGTGGAGGEDDFFGGLCEMDVSSGCLHEDAWYGEVDRDGGHFTEVDEGAEWSDEADGDAERSDEVGSAGNVGGVGNSVGSLVGVGEDGEENDGCELDTEQLVQEAMTRLPLELGEVPIELRPCDITEDLVVEEFMSRGCSCTKWNGKACSQKFTVDYVKKTRLSFRTLTTNELDLVIMGQLIATSNTEAFTNAENRNAAHERKKAYTTPFHQGKTICRAMFLFLHSIGKKRLVNVTRSLKHQGVGPRVHGNYKRLPKHTLSLKSSEYVVRFLLNYTEQHGLLLPGRVPGYSRDDIKLLPSSTSKRKIWEAYFEAAQQEPSVHAVAYSTFCALWRVQLPSIIMMKPMTDLCWTCQKNSTAILRSANCPSAEKSDVLKEAEEHLRIVQVERSYYKTKCDECRKSITSFFTVDEEFQPPPLASCTPPNSKDIKAHYSFDYAQQIHYPSDPLQPGPIYFLVPRKCSVFGVNTEALPRQVNFLNDEAGDCGKGANVVMSQLNFFFDNHGLGEKEVFLHADNCTGQNKNNTMLHYLAWRVMTGRHTQITMSFLVVGHTKFSPDWCFGLLKRLYKRTQVGSLKAMAQVVNDSAKCNFAQLVTAEDGTVIVPTYNWTDLFAPRFKKFAGIKKYHHFRFDHSQPGIVFAKKRADTAEVKVDLLKEPWNPNPTQLPLQVLPKDMSAERQWYLFKKVREFCPETDRDITCPEPTVPKPTSRASTPADDSDGAADANDDDDGSTPALTRPSSSAADNDGSTPPPKKKTRVCGTCKRKGHNSRTCPDKVH